MTLHDWSATDAGMFHSFHMNWIGELTKRLNDGVLPDDFYALNEPHVWRTVPDLLTLQAGPRPAAAGPRAVPGAVAVADRPPRAAQHMVSTALPQGTPRTVAVRGAKDHRLVALVEIVSPANKSSRAGLAEFVAKIRAALRAGVHAVILDVIPPTRPCPDGVHAAVWRDLGQEPYHRPADKPLLSSAYAAGDAVAAYVEPAAAGDAWADLPLFLDAGYYVELPAGAAYADAFRGMARVWRAIDCPPREVV